MSEVIFNFHDTVLLATAFQCLLFVLLLLVAKRDPHLSDYFLVGFFIIQIAIPIHLLIIYGEAFGAVALNFSPNLFFALDIAYWLEGPLLLWYTRSLLNKSFSLSGIDFLYLLPAAIYLLFNILTYFSWDDSEKIAYIQQYHASLAPSLSHLLEALRGSIFIIFGTLCLVEIKHAKQHVHHGYSNILKVDFVWLAVLVAAFIVLRGWMLIVVILAFILPDLGPNPFNVMGLAGNYATFAMVSSLIFFSLTRSNLFAGKISKFEVDTGQEETRPDPVLKDKIERHMRDKKPFLSHYLNLEELAKQLSMHPRALSIAIKHNFHTNFYEFINTYRIEEAKLLLADRENQHSTMIDILGEAGFNSKATFNTFFKKLVKMTPTEYKNSVQKSN